MNLDPSAPARKEFDRLHQQAAIKDLLAQLRGDPIHLLPFEDVRQRLRLSNPAYKGLQDVPLDAIIGSFARYHDFNRVFLPRNAALRERWEAVNRLTAQRDLPPVELYKVSDAFFVSDGHHRISVAHQTGARRIRAHVYEYQTPVPLDSETTLDDLLLKEEYVGFLDHTRLDKSHPEQRIVFTSLGQYQELECQIALYQSALSDIDGRPFGYAEAAAYWYELFYTLIVQVIQQQKLLSGFPGRTEADLFVWLTRHQRELSDAYGYEVSMPEVTAHIKSHHSVGLAGRLLHNLRERLHRHRGPD
jgi:hypothetical protein